MKLLAKGTASDGSKFNLYLDESIETKPYQSPFIEVDEPTFNAFIRNYPNPLAIDQFMDSASWNDFSLHPKWPESVVAMINYGIRDLGTGHIYKIMKDVPAEKTE